MDYLMVARRVLVAALCAAALGACTPNHETAATGGPYAREVAEDIPIIERGTGLTFKRPPVLETRSKAQVRQFLEARFTDQLTDQEIDGQSTFYKRLGLIPDTLDLKSFMIDLLTEQVAGFYDPHTKVLYVVDSAPPDMIGFVIQHELVHALQDQYVNLDSLENVHAQNDRALAAQAVIEGQATLVPIQATLGPGAGLPGGWDRVRDMIRDSRANGMAQFNAAPELLQETLIFPYLSGAEFVRDLELHMPGKQPYGPNMPTSTAQVLHPGSFYTHRQEPLDVILPKPSAGAVTYSDDVGEFETRIFLLQFLHEQNASMRGAAGWAGDHYEVIKFPEGDGIAWLTLWNTSVQSAEFGSDVETIIGRRFNNPQAKDGPAGTVYSLPNDRSVTVWGGTVAGHPGVLYTDFPSGRSASIVRLDKVTVANPPR
ncbi:MAG TPA: hypothetical protein VJO52_02325 [Gemmatimonadaceae bacterium]|nr:hypothetical protein [Gemmatimonadaceae bacterium]